MSILERIRSRICALFVVAALLQPLLALAGEKVGSVADGAFPLWTQQWQDGRFIIIDTATGKHRLAPHQPDVTSSTFTYDPYRAVMWMLVPDPAFPQTLLASFDPATGVTQYHASLGDNAGYSLTYRRHDGMLYALFLRQDGSSRQYYLVRINPESGSLDFVCQIQPMSVDWHMQYGFNNDPPINLVFDPLTDACYYTSAPTGDGGVIFRLDTHSGESTVVMGIGDCSALAFEPLTQRLYGINANSSGSGPPVAFFEFEFSDPAKPNGAGRYVPTVGTLPRTSLAFVPKTVKE
jgi:hypothetical protein